VLASARKLRPNIAPLTPVTKPVAASVEATWVQITSTRALAEERPKRGPYRSWAERLKRTFHFDVLHCPACLGRMRLLAVLTEGDEVRRYLRAIGEPTELPAQAWIRKHPQALQKQRFTPLATCEPHRPCLT
jgi:hypothetical protein